MKLYLLITAFLSGVMFVNAQENSRYKNCDLEQKNAEWLASILKENNEFNKIYLIKKKIEADTIYPPAIRKKITIHDSSLNFEVKDKHENLCGIKILFILEYGKRKNIKLDLYKNPGHKIILQNINSNNVASWILDKTAGLAIYGTNGSSGVVLLRTNDRTLKKIIRKTLN